jgi:hypothetical protein
MPSTCYCCLFVITVVDQTTQASLVSLGDGLSEHVATHVCMREVGGPASRARHQLGRVLSPIEQFDNHRIALLRSIPSACGVVVTRPADD